MEFLRHDSIPPGRHLEESLETRTLRGVIRDLCTQVSPVSAHQIIPENILLPLCISNGPSGPSFLEVLPIDICNHSCSWCFTSDSRSTRVLQVGRFRERIDQFIARGGKAILLSGGGEPLLYKPLIEATPEFDGLMVVEWLAKRHLVVGLITNGVYLDRFIRANSKYLSAVAFIRVSLDACLPEQYRLLHRAREGDFDRVVLGIKTAIERRGAHPAPAIGMSFVVDGNAGMNSTIDDMSAIHRLGVALGVDYVQLKHAHTSSERTADALMLRLCEWSEAFAWDRPQCWIHRYLSSRAESECNIPLVEQLLGADGSRSPCCHLQSVAVPELDLAAGFSPFKVFGCQSVVCRYVSVNRLLKELEGDDTAHIQALQRLKRSLEEHGFHPYRLFPSAPNLAAFSDVSGGMS